MSSFDFQEVFTRIVKYLIEGTVVALVAMFLPSKGLTPGEILVLALSAASIFAILDLLAPAIASSTRTGVGLGIGFNMIGLPM